MKKQVALYARVSSEQQAELKTINSQIDEIVNRITNDGHTINNELCFIDDGHSGATLIRPALERLRDTVASGGVEMIYVHSPDRLSRKYAYQILLIDEFRKSGVEVVFLNNTASDTPEGNLLLQMQGMIAEYERAKILERSRRGKRHAASTGKASVLSTAPYGYEYVRKQHDGSGGIFSICSEEAKIVRQLFYWVGKDRLSTGEVRRRLNQSGISTRHQKLLWDRKTIVDILKNPAYKGMAAYGKTKIGEKRSRLRVIKGSSEQPKRVYSVYKQPKDQWITIPVPQIVEEDLFDAVQIQLKENGKKLRERTSGPKHLLQGLIVCSQCGHAYYGKKVSRKSAKGKPKSHAYYRCLGTDAYRYGGQRICNNQQVRTDMVEEAVWAEIKNVLESPQRLKEEYERRIFNAGKIDAREAEMLEKQLQKAKQGISRLIDTYTNGLIEKNEFEPRIKQMKETVDALNRQKNEILDKQSLKKEMHLVVSKIELFKSSVKEGLDKVSWMTKRNIICSLIKRVEVDLDQVNVVFRIEDVPACIEQEPNFLPHCGECDHPALRRALSRPCYSWTAAFIQGRFNDCSLEPHTDQF